MAGTFLLKAWLQLQRYEERDFIFFYSWRRIAISHSPDVGCLAFEVYKLRLAHLAHFWPCAILRERTPKSFQRSVLQKKSALKRDSYSRSCL